MELGRSSSLPSEVQAPLSYHRDERANTGFSYLMRGCAGLNIAELGTSLMAVQEHRLPLYGEQFCNKKNSCKMQLVDVRSLCGSAVS